MNIAIDEATAAAASSSNITTLLFSCIPAVILLALFVFIWFKAAKAMAGIAADKGYTEKKWFHFCFWLGIAGMLMVCAMPDKNRR